MMEPIEVAKGVLMARILFDGKALQSVVRVINLSDQVYEFQKDELLGEASPAEVCTIGQSTGFLA